MGEVSGSIGVFRQSRRLNWIEIEILFQNKQTSYYSYSVMKIGVFKLSLSRAKQTR